MQTAIAPPMVSLERYLRTSYRPDREYVDGRIERRHSGEYDHNSVQAAVLMYFSQHDKEWGTRTIQEQRTRMGPSTVRIPDICVVPRSRPIEQVYTLPQLIAIEVLSPEDRKLRMQERIEDYRRFGIRHIWVIDPRRKMGWDCSGGEWVATERFEAEGWPVALPLTEFFRQMEEDEA